MWRLFECRIATHLADVVTIELENRLPQNPTTTTTTSIASAVRAQLDDRLLVYYCSRLCGFIALAAKVHADPIAMDATTKLDGRAVESQIRLTSEEINTLVYMVRCRAWK